MAVKRHGLTPETIKKIEEEKRKRRVSKNKDTFCNKKTCLKEINPEEFPGVYFDDLPFIYDENFMACWMCRQESKEDKK